MDVAQVTAALSGEFNLKPEGESCQYGTSSRTPDGVFVMVVEGNVVRIDVTKGDLQTTAGVGIGASEADVRKAYPQHLVTRPHKYTDGHYLIVTPGAPVDTMYRLVFDTDGKFVKSFRGGVAPMVEWVEGCS